MKESLDKGGERISTMFNSIATRYDSINKLLSFRVDRVWRRAVIKRVSQVGVGEREKRQERVKAIDIACGTGDLSIALMRAGMEVTAIDIAEEMVKRAKIKGERALKKGGERFKAIDFRVASANEIPASDSVFEIATISFGIRNFEERAGALKEINRVLKSGGELHILEFALPKNWLWRALYNLYLMRILPFIGGIISGEREAYRYLSNSIVSFPQYEEFVKELEEAGFVEVGYRALTGGISLLYSSKKIVI